MRARTRLRLPVAVGGGGEGIAVHGKTLRERAEALIAIADPRFQGELEDFAVRSHYLERKTAVYA